MEFGLALCPLERLPGAEGILMLIHITDLLALFNWSISETKRLLKSTTLTEAGAEITKKDKKMLQFWCYSIFWWEYRQIFLQHAAQWPDTLITSVHIYKPKIKTSEVWLIFFCVHVQLHDQTFLNSNREQKNTQMCLQVHYTHSLWPKSLFMFLWLCSVRGWAVTTLLCRVCLCVPGQQRGRGSSCHILPLEAISFHTPCAAQANTLTCRYTCETETLPSFPNVLHFHKS